MKFKEYLLKDIATITMGQSPKSQFYNEDGKGIEFLQGVRTFGEDFPYFDTYTTKYNRLAHKNSILFSVRAPVGRVNWATKNIAIGRGVASISVKDMVYDRYVYYYFKKMGSFYDKKATGTVFTSINKKELESLKIKISANYDDQKRIADRLAILDRKIHLNQQLNANLLSQGMLIITHLIGNKEVKKYKISDLNLTVSDHVANGSFKSLKQGVHYFDSRNYALFLRNVDFKNDLSGKLRYIDKPSYDFLKKSHLFGGEVVISNVADVGSVHRVPHLKTHMVVGNNQIFLKSEDRRLTDYLYLYFKSKYGQHDIETITSGSAQQKFNKTDFRSLYIPIISLSKVQEQISPLLQEIDSLKTESKILSNVKNILLSKLF